MMFLVRHVAKTKTKLSSKTNPFLLSSLSSNFLSCQNNLLVEKPLSSLYFFYSSSLPSPHKQSVPKLPLIRDGNYEDATTVAAANVQVCGGCGVHMQNTNPKHPGYFIKPISSSKSPFKKSSRRYLVPISHDITQIPNTLKTGKLDNFEDEDEKLARNSNNKDDEAVVVCARCHSLRHYGRVKDPTVENLLPDFDFDHTLGKRLGKASGARTIVLLVVDAVDFDGSFPRRVASLIDNTITEFSRSWKEGKPGNVPRVVLVVSKIDLLDSSVSPTGFEHWVRQRAREGGLNKISRVHMVSAFRNWGIKGLLDDVKDMAGVRGHVWAIGAQNAGKSTLLNAIGKVVSLGEGGGEKRKVTHLTEAPVPGTTLGIVRVEGVLSSQARLFDTPGLLHPHQITTRLTRDEQKLVHITKELKPRTYRIKTGHTIHIGGLMRLDLEDASVDSVYITVWASALLPLHMGKTENAEKIFKDHFGHQLQPPIGEKRVKELGEWTRREFRVTGGSWESSSVDVAAAGLGWFAIGLKGDAVLGVWTYDGVDLVQRNSLIPHRAKLFEEAGYSVSKVVAKADQAFNKSKRQSENKKARDSNRVMTA